MEAMIWAVSLAFLSIVDMSTGGIAKDLIERIETELGVFPTPQVIYPSDSVRGLQGPLDVELQTSAPSARCVPANGPYCYRYNSTVGERKNGECTFAAAAPCESVVCSSVRNQPFRNYDTNFQFVDPAEQKPIVSEPSCGLVVESDSLIFEVHVQQIDSPTCNFYMDPVQPSIVLSSKELESGYTLSFAVILDDELLTVDRWQFINVTAVSTSGRIGLSFQFDASDEGLSNSTQSGLFKHHRTIKNPATASSILVITTRGVAVFSDGIIAMTALPEGNEIISQVVVGLGSSTFRGTINDFSAFSAGASTNEVYSLCSEEPLAKHVFEENCVCPRRFGDSFSLVGQRENSSLSELWCSSLFDERVMKRYSGRSNDKWAMFTTDGWTSDFTNHLEIEVKFPQTTLTYAVSGTFPGHQIEGGVVIKRPKSMQVKIDNTEGLTVYVSDNCLDEFDVPQIRLPHSKDKSFSGHVSPEQTSNGDVKIRKCYSWTDVLSLHSISRENPSTYSWYIPLLGFNEFSADKNDAFIGKVTIILDGHQYGDAAGTNWYRVGALQLYSKEHCDGYEALLYGAPKNMEDYHNFHKVGAKVFECECPIGIRGDKCESCVDIEGLFRYQQKPRECANCSCSSLAHSSQCQEDTGQCDCGDVDVALAGRQCHWYISKIVPLYGPVAGGTVITITSGYPDLELDVYFDGNLILSGLPTSSRQVFPQTMAATGNNSWSDLEIQAISDGFVISKRHYSFQYRPNPIIRKIQPRSTILSGGTNITITGDHLDSVAFPKMLVNIQQNGRIVGTVRTICHLMNAIEIQCPVGNLSAIVTPLLQGKAAAAVPLEPNLARTTKSSHGLSRKRRQTAGEESANRLVGEVVINGKEQVDFTLGFEFDGYLIYQNLAKSADLTLKALAQLYVYDDPVLVPFADVLEYHPNENTITLPGDKLDYVLSQKDYTVTIGLNGNCEVTSLSTNQLVCHPPEISPEVNANNSKIFNRRPVPHIQVEYASRKIVAGYISYKTDNPEELIGIIVGVVAFCLVAGILIFVVMKRRSKRRKSSEALQGKKNLPAVSLKVSKDQRKSAAAYANSPDVKHEEIELCFPGKKLDPNIQASIDRCRIPAERLKLGKQLGKGNFGAVFKGQLITPSGNLRTVAVKTIKEDKEMSFEDMENFLAEGTLMMDFKHENVLSLIGVVMEDGERPLVVLPYMENSDLCTFIRKDDLELVLADLLHFGLQIANGMAYLANERFVHRDLAARNCMIDGSFIVKIADFGMSRDVYEKDYYTMDNMNKPLPMKWMAVESLKEGRFTSMSDVWAYGITMWELLTRGSTPYPGVNNYYIKEYVSLGKRLDRPSACPPIVYEMMCKCWADIPEERVTFTEIADFIGKLLSGVEIPVTGSDEAAGFYYGRSATKDIPDDYLSSDVMAENDDYITVLSNEGTPTTPSNRSTPIPAPKRNIPADVQIH